MKSKYRPQTETGENESEAFLVISGATASHTEISADEERDEKAKPKVKTNKKNKALRIIKIAFPHFCLTLFILGYVLLGAAVFQRIEYYHDLFILEEKATKIVKSYANIADTVRNVCAEAGVEPVDGWETNLYVHLSQLSGAHERQAFNISGPDADPKTLFSSRWSYIDGTLYAVSILTTTGYVNAIPKTALGQICTVIYGLFGIPLMVLTAVDYGRFLSDIVLFLYSKLAKFGNKVLRFCGCIAAAARRKVSSNVRVETKLLDDGRVEKIDDKKRPKLPLWANFSILLIFNMLGAFVYMLHHETKPDFLESFFVCFNLVANLTMGEVPVVRDLLMVIYIIFFVTFGLAVLSMCADLAASELKWLFLKIHYFGRKIRQKKKQPEDVPVYVEEVELKELLKIIDEIRLRFPQKHKITRQDILDYIQSQINSPKEFLTRTRRDTIAFMPAGIEILKFADADDVDEQSIYPRPSSSADLLAQIQRQNDDDDNDDDEEEEDTSEEDEIETISNMIDL